MGKRNTSNNHPEKSILSKRPCLLCSSRGLRLRADWISPRDNLYETSTFHGKNCVKPTVSGGMFPLTNPLIAGCSHNFRGVSHGHVDLSMMLSLKLL
jgi:hypothetical protein